MQDHAHKQHPLGTKGSVVVCMSYRVQPLGHVGGDVSMRNALEPRQQQHVIVRRELLPQQVLRGAVQGTTERGRGGGGASVTKELLAHHGATSLGICKGKQAASVQQC